MLNYQRVFGLKWQSKTICTKPTHPSFTRIPFNGLENHASHCYHCWIAIELVSPSFLKTVFFGFQLWFLICSCLCCRCAFTKTWWNALHWQICSIPAPKISTHSRITGYKRYHESSCSLLKIAADTSTNLNKSTNYNSHKYFSENHRKSCHNQPQPIPNPSPWGCDQHVPMRLPQQRPHRPQLAVPAPRRGRRRLQRHRAAAGLHHAQVDAARGARTHRLCLVAQMHDIIMAWQKRMTSL